MSRSQDRSERDAAARFRESLAAIEATARDEMGAAQSVAEAIETTGRITYKGRTYLIVDELTGLPSNLVGK